MMRLDMPRPEHHEPPYVPEWEPVPLELPVDDPLRRPPAPAGGDAPPDGEPDPGTVIEIDLY